MTFRCRFVFKIVDRFKLLFFHPIKWLHIVLTAVLYPSKPEPVKILNNIAPAIIPLL